MVVGVCGDLARFGPSAGPAMANLLSMFACCLFVHACRPLSPLDKHDWSVLRTGMPACFLLADCLLKPPPRCICCAPLCSVQIISKETCWLCGRPMWES